MQIRKQARGGGPDALENKQGEEGPMHYKTSKGRRVRCIRKQARGGGSDAL